MAGCCDQVNEIKNFIELGKFLGYLINYINYQLLKRDCPTGCPFRMSAILYLTSSELSDIDSVIK